MASTRYLSTTVVVALLFLSTCVSVILGAIAWSRSVSLFLPFPVSLSASGTLLPLLTIITLLTTNIVFARRNRADVRKRITASNGTSTTTNNNINNNNRPVTHTIITFLIDQFFTLAPAVIATLAATYIFPSGSNAYDTCHFEETWQSYFRAKNANAIRTIQDALRCCGLRSTRDRAWPFKDATHGDDACAVQLGYPQSCLEPWSEVERSTAWMVFVAAVLAWAIKLGLTHFAPSHGTNPFDTSRGEDNNQYRSNLRINGLNGSSSIPRMLPYSDVQNADEHGEDEEEGGAGRGRANSNNSHNSGQNADNDGKNHDNDNNNGQGNRETVSGIGTGARLEYSDSSPWGE